MQDMSKSTNQTIQNTNQSVNETGEAVPIQKKGILWDLNPSIKWDQLL